MKSATGLALIGVGAILAFAVSAQTPGLNLQVAGLIVMLTGLVGLVMPRRASGWLRRQVVLRPGVALPVRPKFEDVSYSPPYLVSDPAVMASQLLEEAELADARARGGRAATAEAAAAARGATSRSTWPGRRAERLRRDDTQPDRPSGQGSDARAQRSAAAVIHDLFTA